MTCRLSLAVTLGAAFRRSFIMYLCRPSETQMPWPVDLGRICAAGHRQAFYWRHTHPLQPGSGQLCPPSGTLSDLHNIWGRVLSSAVWSLAEVTAFNHSLASMVVNDDFGVSVTTWKSMFVQLLCCPHSFLMEFRESQSSSSSLMVCYHYIHNIILKLLKSKYQYFAANVYI